MIITLSPAKILNFDSEVSIKKNSIPVYQQEAVELNSLLKNLSIEKIAALMKVNPELAQSTFEYINTFDMKNVKKAQAAFVYNGIAYQGLDAPSLSEDEFAFAQKHLVLMSGMYGMLRPLDLICPYRLEMQTKLENKEGKDLYAFWRKRLTADMISRMKEGANIWINLTSKEYEKVIDKKELPKGNRIITPVFKEARAEDYKQVVVYAKKARGMMARFIVKHKIDDIEHIKAFDTEGYGYSQQLSTNKEWVFIR